MKNSDDWQVEKEKINQSSIMLRPGIEESDVILSRIVGKIEINPAIWCRSSKVEQSTSES
jgi:hypothetical protein